MAYFLTFSTYGVHLPGDERGSTDRHLGRLPAGVPALEDFATGIMNESPFHLAEPGDREAVLETIVALCVRREWRLMALHVRTTHLHGLVQAEGELPARVMGDWKANSSRVLKTRCPERQRFWARGGDCRTVRDSLDAVIEYILRGQGEPMATYVASPQR